MNTAVRPDRLHRRRVLWRLWMAVGLAHASSVSWAADAHNEKGKERADPPPEPTPVVWRGCRYEAPRFTRTLGLPHNGGYVQATDVKSGRQLWLTEVFSPGAEMGMEADKREVFITRLALSRDRRFLLVTDERGRRALVKLDSGQVVRRFGPA